MSENVKVVIRCRPINIKELDRGCKQIIEIQPELHSITINKDGDEKLSKQFTFDNVYDGDSRQENVYSDVAFSLVESVLSGFNGTIFAYGQTGCGKTHTMEGKRGDFEHMGIIPRAFNHIFNFIETKQDNVT
jgi:kinesin family protein 3/17